MQGRVYKLKEKETRKKFKDNMKELIDNEAKDVWGSSKDEVFEVCEEFCGRRK